MGNVSLRIKGKIVVGVKTEHIIHCPLNDSVISGVLRFAFGLRFQGVEIVIGSQRRETYENKVFTVSLRLNICGFVVNRAEAGDNRIKIGFGEQASADENQNSQEVKLCGTSGAHYTD